MQFLCTHITWKISHELVSISRWNLNLECCFLWKKANAENPEKKGKLEKTLEHYWELTVNATQLWRWILDSILITLMGGAFSPLCNSLSYSRILIASLLWSIRGQIRDWRHHHKEHQWHTRLSPHVPLFFVLTTFWRNLWSVTEQAHGNMESTC